MNDEIIRDCRILLDNIKIVTNLQQSTLTELRRLQERIEHIISKRAYTVVKNRGVERT